MKERFNNSLFYELMQTLINPSHSTREMLNLV